MMVGLIWRSRRILLEVIVRRGVLKTKAAFLLMVFILISHYPPLNNYTYWVIVMLLYIVYYITGYVFFTKPYQQLIRKKIVLFISYICTLEIGPLWVMFMFIKHNNAL